LHALLAQGNQAALTQYLQTVRGDTDLDLLLICDNAQQFVTQAEIGDTGEMCAIEEEASPAFAGGYWEKK
jgi:hypothetical protein